MKKVLLFYACLIFYLPVFAQQLSVEAGSTFNWLRGHMGEGNLYGAARPGLRIGITTTDIISDAISFQYGVCYNAKGGRLLLDRSYTMNGNTVQQQVKGYMRIDYIELPFSVLYSIEQAGGKQFFIGGGAYLGMAFGGIVNYESNEYMSNGNNQQTFSALYPASIGPDGSRNDFKRFDAGLNLQAGYMLRSGFFVRAYGSYGLVNISPAKGSSMKNIGAGLTIGYAL